MLKPITRRHKRPIPGVALGLLLICLSLGCSISTEDLDSWEKVSNGRAKLAGFMKDASRPMELRVHSARTLMRMGAFREIMGVVQETDPQSKEELLRSLGATVIQILTKDKWDDRAKMNAAGLAFYLFEHIDDLKGNSPTGPRDQQLVETVVGWSLEKLKLYDTLPDGPRSFKDIILAASIAMPELALPMVYGFMRSPPNLKRFLFVNQVLSAIKTIEVRQEQARLLLAEAKRTHPKVDPELAVEMMKNRNETLLRFLLDCVRDDRVPPETRNMGMKAAQLLKERGLDVLFALLKTDDPKNGNISRLNALRLIWDFGGAKQLAAALRALPSMGTWFPDGTDFKDRIDEFCQSRLAPAAAEVRETLVSLLSEDNWVTRVYAMECIITLYPEDASSLLQPLAKDNTVLEGWIDEGETTIASVVKALTAQ